MVAGSPEGTGQALITLDQAAEAIFCSRRTLERWIAAGELVVHRSEAGRILVTLADVMRLERTRRNNKLSRLHTRGAPLVKQRSLS